MCHACGTEKPASEFGREPRNRDGLQRRCTDCERIRKRALRAKVRAADPDAERARRRSQYWANPTHYREYARGVAAQLRAETPGADAAKQRAYRAANPERVLKRQRAYNEATRDARCARSRAKYAADPSRLLVHYQKRRARKSSAPGSGIAAEQWKQILSDWGHRCAYCMVESKYTKLSMDHVDPLCTGGAHDESNIVPACKSCNSSKRDRTFDELVESPHSLVTQRLMAWL